MNEEKYNQIDFYFPDSIDFIQLSGAINLQPALLMGGHTSYCNVYFYRLDFDNFCPLACVSQNLIKFKKVQ